METGKGQLIFEKLEGEELKKALVQRLTTHKPKPLTIEPLTRSVAPDGTRHYGPPYSFTEHTVNK